ncbi:4224_t:CDS:2 [Dentiscutata erythropus]|uniref:DNA 3'-5' helicase n=1 Tax=Dentiscutata erythropus TaxID=1348616 RepID=A0A9N9JXE9_9GLOM|nr:4224_t:CDS:2 [Dentiscutata erythropus]
MTMTATCRHSDIEYLQNNLQINPAKFSIIHGNILAHQELQFEVHKKKDKEIEIIKQLIDLIEEIKEGRIIIYCARKKDCDNLIKKKETRIMIMTTAFEMGMDIDDVRLVIYYSYPFSITNLVQGSERARRDNNHSKSIVLYSKNDLQNNYSILIENKESMISENYTRSLKVYNIEQNLFEVIFYCIDLYRCRQIILWQYFAWPNDMIPTSCNICDNCRRRIHDKLKEINAVQEVQKLVELVEELTNRFDSEIILLDIVELFRFADNSRLRKRGFDTIIEERAEALRIGKQSKSKILKNKNLVTFVFWDLVCRGLVKQKIVIHQTIANHRICSVVVCGVENGAKEHLLQENWTYWCK